MGTINRQGTAPIQNGDSRLASEVEAEFNTLFTEVNGSLSNVNFKSAANISGGKLAAATVAANRFTASTLTTLQLAPSAATKAQVETVTSASSVTFTTSVSYVDVDGFSGLTLTPGSASDMLYLSFHATINIGASNTGTWLFGFSVGGTENDAQEVGLFRTATTNSPQVLSVSYMGVTGSVAPLLVKPRYKKLAGSGAIFVDDSLRVFRAVIFPIK